jgi:hypothetical protein
VEGQASNLLDEDGDIGGVNLSAEPLDEGSVLFEGRVLRGPNTKEV